MSESACAMVPANLDVTGLGIRVNIYFSCLLLAVVPVAPPSTRLLETLQINMFLTCLAVLVMAILETANNQLSLFHALVCFQILLGFGANASPFRRYSMKQASARIAVLGLFATLTTLISVAWSLHLWSHMESFGSHPECNDQTKYVFFFVTVRATVRWLKIVQLVLLSLPFVLLGMAVIGGLLSGCFQVNPLGCAGSRRTDENPSLVRRLLTHFSWLCWAIWNIVTLELIIKHNTIVESVRTEWSFGQIFPIVMIFASVNEVGVACYKWIADDEYESDVYGVQTREQRGSWWMRRSASNASGGTLPSNF